MFVGSRLLVDWWLLFMVLRGFADCLWFGFGVFCAVLCVVCCVVIGIVCCWWFVS